MGSRDAAALQTIFGMALDEATVAPMRGGIGDCGAGAQALDLVAASLILKEQAVPPAVNVSRPIAGLPIESRKIARPVTHALVLATALGGQNSAVILRRVN